MTNLRLLFSSSTNALLFLFFLLPEFAGRAQTPSVVRGPYLQMGTSSGITIRWSTQTPTDSRVRFGTDISQLTQQVTDTSRTTDHVVRLSGLKASTRYHYTVGSSSAASGTSPDQYFITAPAVGSTAPVRIWALGDFGSGDANQRNARDQFLAATGNRHPDLWLWMGDNAYCCGRDFEYQQNVFNTYPTVLPNLPFWPTPGNHDYADNPFNFNIHYYSMITVPQQAEAGGLASGTKAYYSFDYGQIHFVSLDSYGYENGQHRLADTTGKQVEWLKRDLSANRQPWTVVFFHHPPYAKGSKNSDTDPELIGIRQKLVPILERYKVDLVLMGHSHTYERSYQLNGYVGTSEQFNPAQHVVSGTTGRYDGSANSCPIIQKGKGTVYVVNGSGGQIGGQSPGWPHPAMVYANNTIAGSMLIDVVENRLDARFICADGVTRDQFTIMKEVSQTRTIRLPYGETARLTASWPSQNGTDAYRWSEGKTSLRTLEVSPQQSTRYTVTDEQKCLQDVFDVTVLQPTGLEPDKKLTVFPNPASDRVTVELTLPAPAPLAWHLFDLSGQCLGERTFPASQTLSDQISLPAGTAVFLLQVTAGEKVYTRKILRQ